MNIRLIIFFFVSAFSVVFAQNGLVQTYYANGATESEVFYVRDAIDGTAKWYYENGVLKEEKNYMLGKLNGWVRTFYENSAPKEEYFITDGRLDGLYKTFYDNGGIKTITEYDNGLKKSTKTFAYDKTLAPPKIEIKKEEPVQVAQETPVAEKPAAKTRKNNSVNVPKDGLKIYDEDVMPFLLALDQKPEPIGGIPAIMDKVKVPELAKQAKVQGEVVVRAFVNEIGMVTATQLIKGLGFGCDEVARNAVQKTPFRPGKAQGKPVKAQIDISVRFK